MPATPSAWKRRLSRTVIGCLPFSVRSAASRFARFSGTSGVVWPAPASPASRGPIPNSIREPPAGRSFA